MGCGSSSTPSSTETVNETSAPPAAYLNAYTNLVNQAGQVAQQPLNIYSGATVAGFTPAQTTAMNTVDQSQGIANPYINAASEYAANSTTPVMSQVQGFSPSAVSEYESPYTQQVVNSTENEFANTNAQQQAQLTSQAAAQGALGGDRLGVAQGILAGQQQLSEAPTIAGLENQGYTQALGELNTQQQTQLSGTEASDWLNSQAGFAMGNLGSEAQNTALTGASAQLQTGALQQQLAQEELNVPYENFEQEEAYPFQTTGWLAGITEGLGGSSGGTSSTTSPVYGPSTASQIAGLGLTGLGLYNSGALGSLGSLLGTGAESAADFGTVGSAAAGASDVTDLGEDLLMASARGGRITRAGGGSVPGFALGGDIPIPALLGAGSGTSTITGGAAPAGGGLQEIAGLGADLYGAYNAVMAVAPYIAAAFAARNGGRIRRDAGGGVPGFSAPLPALPDYSTTIVPAAQQGQRGAAAIPRAPAVARPSTSGSLTSGMQDVELATAIGKLLNPSANTGGGSGLARGGRSTHAPGFQGGGATAGAAVAGIPGAAGAPGTPQSNYLQRLLSMSDEQLQELSGRMPPGSPQGQLLQRAITMKRMNPNTQGLQQATQAQAANSQSPTAFSPTAGFSNGQGGFGGVTTQPFARGGRPVPGFAAGGTTLPALSVPPSMSSFTSPGGVTVPLLPTAGLAPGTSLSMAPTSNFTAPPPSTASVTPVTYPTLTGGSGAPSFGATTTLGAQASAPSATPSTSPTAAPASAAYNPFSGIAPSPSDPNFSSDLAAYLTYMSNEGFSFRRGGAARNVAGFADGGAPVPGDTVLSGNGTYVPLTSLDAGDSDPDPNYWGSARGGRLRAGFADGGGPDADDMVTADDGSYVPLSSLQTGPDGPPPPPSPGFGPASPSSSSGFGSSPAPSSSDHGASGSSAIPVRPSAAGQPGFADNRWEPLLAAGLGMLAGQSRYAAVNIGQGGLEGLKTAEAQQQRADTVAGRQATIDEDANRLLETANYHKGDLDVRDKEAQNQAEADQEHAATDKAHLAIEGQQANTAAARLDQDRFQWQPGLGPDPSDPTKQTAGVWRFSTRQGEGPQFTPGAVLAGQQKLNQAIDKSGPTVRQWDSTTNSWVDTGTPTTAQERADATQQNADTRSAQAAQGRFKYQAGVNADPNGNKVPGVWQLDSTGQHAPQFLPSVEFSGANGAGGRPSVFAEKRGAWLALHPNDAQGALDYASGHRELSPADAAKFGLQQAQRELGPGASSDDIDARAGVLADAVRAGKTPPPPPPDAPGRGWFSSIFGGGSPAPQNSAAAATPPQPKPRPTPAPTAANAAAPAAPTPKQSAPKPSPQNAAPAIPPLPAGVPSGAKWSPSQGSWWWQDQSGKWQTAPGQQQ